MKNLLLFLSLFLGPMVTIQAQTDYMQWEVMTITPKQGQRALLDKGLAAHHKAYHASDPYKVWIWEVLTGPNSGDLDWVMGPTTWTQMDGRPASVEHDADWAKNVDPYIEAYGEVSHWRMDKDRVYEPENAASFGKSRLRFSTLLPRERNRYEEQLNKVVAVYKAKKYGAAFRVYWRYGLDEGPHVATDMSFATWAFLDSGIDFPKDFDEVHGAGSYERFLDEIALCVDRAKSYDVLQEFKPDLSSPSN